MHLIKNIQQQGEAGDFNFIPVIPVQYMGNKPNVAVFDIIEQNVNKFSTNSQNAQNKW